MRWIKLSFPSGTKNDRIVMRFLWLPKHIGTEVRWLESASWKELLVRQSDGVCRWEPLWWITIGHDPEGW